MCIDALNFEVAIDGGYRRVDGYERFDGRPAPSDAVYYSYAVSFSGTVTAGDTLTGKTSGATGRVIVVTATTIYYTKQTGTFTASENLSVTGGTTGVSKGAVQTQANLS
jgi:hypothetical protein